VANGLNQDGERFGRFTLLQRLAAGGMAEVYLARLSGEAGFEKHLVIKKILPSLARDQEFVERLIREGKLVAGLTHGNIVQVQELGQENEEFYLAMDYVAGTDLRELMAAVRRAGAVFPEPVAAHFLLQIARALAYAHTKVDGDGALLGIVHRDVSPANVLVSWEGEIKLTDFGIARVQQEGRVLTSAGMLRGKVPYMSPEQVEGDILGPESDVFSFGVLAYELLAGVRPFDGESDLQTLDRIRAAEKENLASLNPDLAPFFTELVESCLARDRSARPASGEELERSLAEHMAAQGWVVSNADVAAMLDQRFPKDSPERSRAPTTGVTVSGTASSITATPRDRIPTKSLAVPAPRMGAGRWALLGLVLLLAVGAVSFGLGLVVDWHRGEGRHPGDAATMDGAVAPDQVTGAADTPRSAVAPDVVDAAMDLSESEPGAARPGADVVRASGLSESEPGARRPDADAVRAADLSESEPGAARPDADVVEAADIATDTITDAQSVLPPEPRRPGPSVTRIDVIPRGAAIEIDGRVVGDGSYVLRLQPGARAAVRLTHPGYSVELFTLRHPAPRKISKRLRAMPTGSLKIRYLPANAALFLDGKPVKTGDGLNIVVLKTHAGPHTLRLVDPGGGESTREVEVREGEQVGITLRIE